MQTQGLRKSAFFALACLLVLLIGAVVFYEERMLLADAPWSLYYIINTKSFFIQQHRYGSFITQLFPFIGVLLHLPLKAILLLYSSSFNLFYFSSGVILFFKRQYLLVIMLAFYHTLCVTDGYYWTNNEVHQGITWMCLALGVMFYKGKAPVLKHYLCFLLLAFLAIFSHPIVIMAMGFTTVFVVLANKGFFSTKSILYYSLILAIITGVKYYFSINGYYDSSKIEYLSSASRQQLLNVLNTCTGRLFLKSCVIQYWQFSLLTLGGLFYMVWKRHFSALLWCLLTGIVYFVSICIVYPNCDTVFYIESEWMAITFIGVFPFVFLVLPQLNERTACLLVIGIFICRIFQIYNHAEKFEQRVHTIKKMVQVAQQDSMTKVSIIQTPEDVLANKLLMTWGLPVETLIWSNINGPQRNAVTIVYLHEPEMIRFRSISGKHKFINAFDTQNYSKLNPEYFWFDTSRPYELNNSFKSIK